MKLYHGSKHNLEEIINKQASNGSFDYVPEEELQDGIYLTPNYKFALAMAAGPYGGTSIDDGKISFEHQELFNPDQNIFVYVFDTEEEQFKDKKLEYHNENEYLLKGENKLIPSKIETVKASEVFKYYELTEWKNLREIKPEQKIKLR